MTDASSSSQDQNQQPIVQIPTPSSQASDGTRHPQQSKVKGLDTLFPELVSISKKLDASTPKARARKLWQSYRRAIFFANHYKRASGIQAQDMDLDTATVNEISQLQRMSDWEKQALDAYHATLKVVRARMTVLAEIEEWSSKNMALDDETPNGIYLARKAQAALEDIQKERRDIIDFVKAFQHQLR